MNRNDLIDELARASHQTWRRQRCEEKGEPLGGISSSVTAHDLERAEDAVKTLERLGLFPPKLVNLPDEDISLEEIERAAIIEALKRFDWLQARAAEFLRMRANTLSYKIISLRIERPPGPRKRSRRGMINQANVSKGVVWTDRSA